MDLKDITGDKIEVLKVLKDLKEFKEGDFKDLDEKVDAFIAGSNEAEYEFDEEEFRVCLHELCEEKYITGWYDEDKDMEFVVGDITPAGLKLVGEMEKENEAEDKAVKTEEKPKKGWKFSFFNNSKINNGKKITFNLNVTQINNYTSQ